MNAKVNIEMDHYNKSYFDERYNQRKFFLDAETRHQYLFKARLKVILNYVSNLESALEVGCGYGGMTSVLNETFKKLSAIDISKNAIEHCHSLPKLKGVDLSIMDSNDLVFPDNTFDLVTIFDVLEHLQEPNITIKNIYRVLKQNGILILSTPNPRSVGHYLKEGPSKKYFGKPLESRKKQWFGYQDDSHISLLTISKWRELLVRNNFMLLEDGTDYLWDSPYLPMVPTIIQDIMFKGAHRVLTKVRYFRSWELGENYIGIYSKQ